MPSDDPSTAGEPSAPGSESAKTAPHVVCISHSPGSGGESVGQAVSTALGFRYIDEEIVSRAAQKLEVPANLVADVERRKPLLERVLVELQESGALYAYAFAFVPLPDAEPKSADYRALIQQVLYETAEHGDVVIVAHGASIALGGRPNVLRVLITASAETRARRLAEDRKLAPAEAAKRVSQDDRDRADYLKRFYKVDRELPTHYDLVVNTDTLSVEDAGKLVLAACDHSDAA